MLQSHSGNYQAYIVYHVKFEPFLWKMFFIAVGLQFNRKFE